MVDFPVCAYLPCFAVFMAGIPKEVDRSKSERPVFDLISIAAQGLCRYTIDHRGSMLVHLAVKVDQTNQTA